MFLCLCVSSVITEMKLYPEVIVLRTLSFLAALLLLFLFLFEGTGAIWWRLQILLLGRWLLPLAVIFALL